MKQKYSKNIYFVKISFYEGHLSSLHNISSLFKISNLVNKIHNFKELFKADHFLMMNVIMDLLIIQK
jgi:hypothetical protein